MSHWTGKTEHIGIYGEILARAREAHTPDDAVHLINPERLKTTLLELLYEAGVTW